MNATRRKLLSPFIGDIGGSHSDARLGQGTAPTTCLGLEIAGLRLSPESKDRLLRNRQ
jgi:hypothetical protein